MRLAREEGSQPGGRRGAEEACPAAGRRSQHGSGACTSRLCNVLSIAEREEAGRRHWTRPTWWSRAEPREPLRAQVHAIGARVRARSSTSQASSACSLGGVFSHFTQYIARSSYSCTVYAPNACCDSPPSSPSLLSRRLCCSRAILLLSTAQCTQCSLRAPSAVYSPTALQPYSPLSNALFLWHLAPPATRLRVAAVRYRRLDRSRCHSARSTRAHAHSHTRSGQRDIFCHATTCTSAAAHTFTVRLALLHQLRPV